MKESGITYIETIAALAMVGLAVVAATSMTAAHPVASARLVAQEDMVRALDSLLEDVRAGLVPLESGPVVSPIATPTEIMLHLGVDQSEISGLVWVRATARADVRGQNLERTMTSAIWNSP